MPVRWRDKVCLWFPHRPGYILLVLCSALEWAKVLHRMIWNWVPWWDWLLTFAHRQTTQKFCSACIKYLCFAQPHEVDLRMWWGAALPSLRGWSISTPPVPLPWRPPAHLPVWLHIIPHLSLLTLMLCHSVTGWGNSVNTNCSPPASCHNSQVRPAPKPEISQRPQVWVPQWWPPSASDQESNLSPHSPQTPYSHMLLPSLLWVLHPMCLQWWQLTLLSSNARSVPSVMLSDSHCPRDWRKSWSKPRIDSYRSLHKNDGCQCLRS